MNNIMSRIRKFVRILNNEPILNYKVSLPIIEKRKDKSSIINQELISIFKTIGKKRNLQISLIFFFLYYIGLTYSKVARIRIKDFHSSLSILIDKKSKNKKFILPKIIQEILYEFIFEKENKTNFLFYDEVKEITVISRTKRIKNNLTKIVLE